MKKLTAISRLYRDFLKEDARLQQLVDKGELEGHPFIECTNCARWIKENYLPEAIIVGYFHENNPTAEVGKSEGGHDFLFMDGRYIIDFWPRINYGREWPVFFDIERQSVWTIRKYYGRKLAWHPIPNQ